MPMEMRIIPKMSGKSTICFTFWTLRSTNKHMPFLGCHVQKVKQIVLFPDILGIIRISIGIFAHRNNFSLFVVCVWLELVTKLCEGVLRPKISFLLFNLLVFELYEDHMKLLLWYLSLRRVYKFLILHEEPSFDAKYPLHNMQVIRDTDLLIRSETLGGWWLLHL